MERLSSEGSSSPNSLDLPGFPTRPHSSNMGKPVSVLSNFYQMKTNTGGRNTLFSYQVKTTPNLTCHTNDEKQRMRKVARSHRAQLEEVFDNFIYFEGFIYSFERVEDDELPSSLTGKVDDVEYTASYEYHQELEFSNQTVSIFFRAFLNQMINKVGFKQVRGGKHFNPLKPRELNGVSMFPAFFNTMKALDSVIYLNLNPSVKFFQ